MKKIKSSESKPESKSSCVLITETVGESLRKGEAVVKRGRGRPAKNPAAVEAKKRGRKPNAKPEDEAEEEEGDKVWICPGCSQPDDGSPMIGCDNCDEWYHWPCVGIKREPDPDKEWFCPRCAKKKSAEKLAAGQSPKKIGASKPSPEPAPSKTSTNKVSTGKKSKLTASTKSSSASSAANVPAKRGRPPKNKTINKSSPANKRQRRRSTVSSYTTSEEDEDALTDASDASCTESSSASSTPTPLTASFPRKTARKSTTVPPKGPSKRGRPPKYSSGNI